MFRALLWLDIKLFWLLTLGAAKQGETISAAAYRGEQQGRIIGRIARPVIDLLLCWIGPQPHCKQAYEWQREIYRE